MSAAKKNAPRKRSSDYPYAPVSMILNGIKYKPGQKPARVCVASRPSTPSERFMADALSATADHIQGLRDQLAPLSGGRVKGRPNKKTVAVRAHISELLAQHPRLKSITTQLYKRADKKIIGSMAETTFSKHVRAVNGK